LAFNGWSNFSNLNLGALYFKLLILVFRIQSLSPLKKKIQELNTNIISGLNESYKEAAI